MNGDGPVSLDTSDLQRGMAQLAAGLERAGPAVALVEAQRVASRIRSSTPSRTGRLRSTVNATRTTDGAEVHYGGALPYAAYIARRSHALDSATDGAASTFRAGLQAATAAEIRRL